METQSRRSFASLVTSGLGSLIGIALAAPSAIYLLVGSRSNQRHSFVEAADLSKLEIGKPQEVQFERIRVDGWRRFSEKVIAWVVRTDEKKVIAYAPQCTHLGCAYHWEAPKNQFVCPCHDSLFSIEGKVMGGPAGRPLDRYATKVENSKLLIGQIEKQV